MKRVIGIGGIFFKSKNPKRLIAWYRKHLGMEPAWEGGVVFDWESAKHPGRRGQTVWSPFPANTDYFRPGKEPYMINYIVENLDSLLAELRKERVKVLSQKQESEFGRFAWIRIRKAGASSCGNRPFNARSGRRNSGSPRTLNGRWTLSIRGHGRRGPAWLRCARHPSAPERR